MNQIQALEILKTGANVFLTGEPGSGKTYTINKYVQYLRSHGIDPAITASTGIAATHIGGMTIHSWAGIGIKDFLNKRDLRDIATNENISKRIGRTKILIIDEISMLPSNTLQMIDAVIREIKKSPLPFGGIQVVLVGDFFQLPPVTKKTYDKNRQTEFFDQLSSRFSYQSPVWQQAEFVTCYITEQYRQDDDQLLSILSKIRSNTFDDLSLEIIAGRKSVGTNLPENVTKLYSHNIDVDTVNDLMLAKISGKQRLFSMRTKGPENLLKSMKKGCLSPEKLYLKIGASVMFTKNNSKEDYVNGTLGEVVSFDHESGLPVVKIRNGRKVKVNYADWTLEEDGKIKGQLSQLPLRLAWAVTVHKSQGISLDSAVIDLSKVFEFGQGYVALSRVRRLSGIYLLGWNEVAFKVDPEVLEFDDELRKQSTQAQKIYSEISAAEKKKLSEDFINSCGGKVSSSDNSSKIKSLKADTYIETLYLWKKGLLIKEISEVRMLNLGTIINHFEKLVERGDIKRDELTSLVSPKFLSVTPNIHDVFISLETDKLTPVYKFFDGKYSYDDLKLARLMMKTKQDSK